MFLELYRRRHGKNYFANATIVVVGILLGVGVTAAGFFNQGVLAGVLGLFVTLFIALQNAFTFHEKSEFQRILFTEAENLVAELHHRVRTRTEFDAIFDAYQTLRKHAATNLPKGKGMDVVREIYGGMLQTPK